MKGLLLFSNSSFFQDFAIEDVLVPGRGAGSSPSRIYLLLSEASEDSSSSHFRRGDACLVGMVSGGIW